MYGYIPLCPSWFHKAMVNSPIALRIIWVTERKSWRRNVSSIFIVKISSTISSCNIYPTWNPSHPTLWSVKFILISVAYVNHDRIRSCNQCKVSCSRKQREPLLGFELPTDRHQATTNQTRDTLRHAVNKYIKLLWILFYFWWEHSLLFFLFSLALKFIIFSLTHSCTWRIYILLPIQSMKKRVSRINIS